MALSSVQVDFVVALIRGGWEATVGRSRGHITYTTREGELYVSEYDDGGGSDRPCSEAELRGAIFHEPESFAEILRAGSRAALREALIAGSPDARQRLREVVAFGKELVTWPELVVAVIEWPARAPDAQMLWLIGRLNGYDVYQSITSAIGPETRTPAAGALGVRIFAAVVEMLGGRELPHWRRYRAQFRAMAGDWEGARADLEWVRARMADGDPDLPPLQREIDQLMDQRLLAAIATAPDDDAARLVWADRLSERGDPRGELIVAQCAVAQLGEDDPGRASLDPRIMQLVALHGREWGRLGDVFARGFVDSAEVRWPAFGAEADRLFAISPPLRELRFRMEPGDRMADPAEVLEEPRLERVPALDLSDPALRRGGVITGPEPGA